MNVDEVSFQKCSNGDRFEFEVGWVGLELGSRKLGFNVTVFPPGKSAWPFHSHHANEEMFCHFIRLVDAVDYWEGEE